MMDKETDRMTTDMVTMNFINAATVRLEWEFAPTSTEHGCMIDVMGIGILISELT